MFNRKYSDCSYNFSDPDNTPAICLWFFGTVVTLLALGDCFSNKSKEHLYKLRTDPNYVQAYYEKSHPFKMWETKKGIEMRILFRGWPIKGLDSDKDGIINEISGWIGGGRMGFIKVEYKPNDFEYEEIQRRYTKSLARTDS